MFFRKIEVLKNAAKDIEMVTGNKVALPLSTCVSKTTCMYFHAL